MSNQPDERIIVVFIPRVFGRLRILQMLKILLRKSSFSYFRTLGSFRIGLSLTTWLHSLTVNHVLMHFRKHKRRLRSEQFTEDVEMPAQVAVTKPTNIVDRILLSEVMAKPPDID
jgi:hypothetical protein